MDPTAHPFYRILKWHFSSLEHDDHGINETRGYACEYVAWRFLTRLSRYDLIDYLLNQLPASSNSADHPVDVEASDNHLDGADESLFEDRTDEYSALLWDRRRLPKKLSWLKTSNAGIESPEFGDELSNSTCEDLTSSFVGSNALEIAAITSAKNFLSQRVVQKIVNDIWSGDIVFWESLNVHSKKKARVYNKKYVISLFSFLHHLRKLHY